MNAQVQKNHISTQFDTELEAVRQRVLSMGGLVEQQVNEAARALMEGDNELGAAVKSREPAVDQFEIAIDEECCVLLARRQPAARDLRLVYSIIKVTTDLERIGDEAEKIALMAMDVVSLDTRDAPLVDLRHLARHVSRTVRDVLDAFARMDAAAALNAGRECDVLDREYEALMRQCITFMMEDPRTIRHVMDMLWSVRALERIDRHARDIADYVIYLVGGTDVRHSSREAVERAAGEIGV